MEIMRRVNDFTNGAFALTNVGLPVIYNSWKTPKFKWIKVNYETTSMHGGYRMACGGVISDYTRQWIKVSI